MRMCLGCSLSLETAQAAQAEAQQVLSHVRGKAPVAFGRMLLAPGSKAFIGFSKWQESGLRRRPRPMRLLPFLGCKPQAMSL